MDIRYRDDLDGHFRKSQVSPLPHLPAIFIVSRNSVALYIASLAEVGQGRILSRIEIAAIAWGVNIASGIVNTIGTKAIGRMSTFNVWWTLGGTFVLVITLLVKAPEKVR